MPVFKPIIKGGGSGDLTIEGQQTITGILTGTVDEFDTVYSEIISDGSNWDTVHNKLSDPADLPPNGGRGVAFSSDNTYMAVGHYWSPFITVYKRSGDTFTKLSGITAPAGNGKGVAFSSDNTYMAVAHNVSPYITVYKRSGDTFTKLTGIEALPNAGWSVAFSSDDTYLAVAHDTSPRLTIYKTTLINPTTLISPALNEVPLGYHDLGYALESGVEDAEIEMVSIFR